MTREEKIAELIFIRDNYNYTLAPREVFDDAIKALENQKTGHWIRQKGIYGLADTCECSVCGRTIYAENEDDLKDYPYCHCGAKMEGDN